MSDKVSREYLVKLRQAYIDELLDVQRKKASSSSDTSESATGMMSTTTTTTTSTTATEDDLPPIPVAVHRPPAPDPSPFPPLSSASPAYHRLVKSKYRALQQLQDAEQLLLECGASLLGKRPLDKALSKLVKAMNSLVGSRASFRPTIAIEVFPRDYLESRGREILANVLHLTCRCWTVPSFMHRRKDSGYDRCNVTLAYNGHSLLLSVSEFLLWVNFGISKQDVAKQTNVPVGCLQLSHLCHLPLCCNPAHAVIEPSWDNNRRNQCQFLQVCVCGLPARCLFDCHPPSMKLLHASPRSGHPGSGAAIKRRHPGSN